MSALLQIINLCSENASPSMLHILFGCMHIGVGGLVLNIFPFIFLNIPLVFMELRWRSLRELLYSTLPLNKGTVRSLPKRIWGKLWPSVIADFPSHRTHIHIHTYTRRSGARAVLPEATLGTWRLSSQKAWVITTIASEVTKTLSANCPLRTHLQGSASTRIPEKFWFCKTVKIL